MFMSMTINRPTLPNVVALVVAVGAFTVSGASSPQSATSSEPAASGGVADTPNAADTSPTPCDPLCYGISDDQAVDVLHAHGQGVRLFRKVTPWDVEKRHGTEAIYDSTRV
jgi:hypothetical protein